MIKPTTDTENFFRDGRDFKIYVIQDGKTIEVRIYEIVEPDREVVIHKNSHPPQSEAAELFTAAKEFIEGYVFK